MHRPDDAVDVGNADLFDHDQIRHYVQFIVGSVRRRRWLAAAVFAAIMILAAVALALLPRTYHAEAKLLAQRSQMLAIRGDGPDASAAPTRGAAETVLQRDNLEAIIRATDLLQHTREHLSASQRALRWVAGLLAEPPTEQDEMDAMVERLQKKLGVWTTDGTVSIGVDWSDAAMAVRLVDAAQSNFFETRRAQEITALVESIAIVRGHAASLQTDIDEAVVAIEKLRERRAPRKNDAPASAAPWRPAPSAPSTPSMASRPSETGPEMAVLRGAIEARQRSIDELEESNRRRLAEAQGRLLEQRATLTDNHPAVVELQKTVAALGAPSPQAAAMRKELASLQSELASKRVERRDDPSPRTVSWSVGAGAGAAATPPQLPSEVVRLDSELREDRDPVTVYARGRLRDAMEKYSLLRSQVQTAQIELETAQAAFKYRYRVLSPAQVPKKPSKPGVPLLAMLAMMAASLSAVVVVTVADVRAGRLVERWQIEELLGGPILAEIETPRLPMRGPE